MWDVRRGTWDVGSWDVVVARGLALLGRRWQHGGSWVAG
jgi:hypothetical protein